MQRKVREKEREHAILNKAGKGVFVAVLVAILFTLLPLTVDRYTLHTLILCQIFVVISVCWNLLAMTRQVSLGHAAFFGLGAYTSALLSDRLSTPPWLDIASGGIVASFGAVILGLICLRMAPWALAIVTFSFAEALRVISSMIAFTDGAQGISLSPLFEGNPNNKLLSYYMILIIALITVVTVYFVIQSRLSYAFRAIHDDEQAASTLGVNPVLFKLLAFTISAFFTGLAGGFYAHYTTHIEPATAFNVHISVEAQLMPLIGGLYTFVGPIIGAFVLTLMTEYLRVSFGQGYMIFYGIILVVTILFLPEGVVGIYKIVWSKVRRTGLAREV
jgi:branched-chain amino acid transport system permease protein